MEDLQRVLREHHFLKGLSDDHIRLVVGCTNNMRFKKTEYLLREGAASGTFYLLREGQVSLEAYVSGKGVMRLETVEPGDVLGVSWAFPPSRAHLDARALEPVLAFAVDGACLHAKMEADHALGYALMKPLLEATYARLERSRLQGLDVYRTGV